MTIHSNSIATDAKKNQPSYTVHYNSFASIVFIVVMTLLVMVVFQRIQISNEHKILQNTKSSQEGSLQESRKLRAQLNSIASQTAQLAAQGNPNAKIIIEELRKRGITVTLNSKTSD